MAYTGKLTSTPASLYALKQKAFSKKLHNFPADKNADSVDELAPQNALWPVYLCIQASIENDSDPLSERFTRFISNVHLRNGFLHQEIGDTVADIVKKDSQPEPGADLTYKMFPYPRIFSESIENEAVHVMAVYNDYEHRNSDKFIDIEAWNSVRARTVEFTSNAIKNFIDLFIKSILLSGNPTSFMSDSLLLYLWGEGMVGDDSFSKSMKALIDENGEFKKLCKNAAGYFKKYFKNIFYFDPSYDLLWDSKWDSPIPPVKKPDKDSASNVNDLKTIMQTRYTQKDGNNKNNPIKGLNRITCIYSMLGVLSTLLIRMTNIKSASNAMNFDRNATAEATSVQFLCKGETNHLILIMNPEDLADCRNGASVTGPNGTNSRSFSQIESMVSGVYALEGMLPGEAYILDDRIINLFPFFSEVLEHKNVQHLVTQFFTHYKFKWAIFANFCAIKVIATKWNPGSYFYSRYLEDFKNA